MKITRVRHSRAGGNPDGQRAIGRAALPAVRDLGLLTLVGVGIAVSNGRAVLDAFRGGTAGTVFVRTPKLGAGASGRSSPVNRYRARPDGLLWLELSISAYCLMTAVALVVYGVYVIVPFMLLDAAGSTCVAAMGRTP